MSKRWNIVVVMLDDMPADGWNYMAYANGGLQAAHGNVVTFPRSYSPLPQCGPIRSTLLTGQYPSRSGVVNNHTADLLDWSSMFNASLNRAGYACGHFGKVINAYPFGNGSAWVPPGWDEWRGATDPPSYHSYTLNENGIPTNYGTGDANYFTDVVHAKALSWVQTVREPFYAQVWHWAPHSNHTPATRHAGTYSAEPIVRHGSHNEADISDKPAWLQQETPNPGSAGEVSTRDSDRRKSWEAELAVDESIEGLVDALATRGVLDRTLFVILNDNVQLHHEHRLTGKAVPYEVCTNTGLRMRWPGATAGPNNALVTSLDLPATFCDIAGAHMPTAPDGMSLVPLVEGDVVPENWREEIYLEFGGQPDSGSGGPALPTPPWRAIRTADDRWYHEWDDGSREVYDLSTDPAELTNLYPSIGDDGLAQRLARLAP